MNSMGARRWFAIGVCAVVGAVGAFSVGAGVATRIERHMHSVSVAKIPVHDLTSHRAQPPPNAVAKK